MRSRGLLRLAMFIGLCLAVGVVAGVLTVSSVATWYAGIRKPSWTPPGALFGPVWTALYVMIGVAGWLVHRAPAGPGRGAAITCWWIQLGLNFLWSLIFFLLRAPGPALADIVLLLCSIVAFIVTAVRVDVRGVLLFLPYAAWVSFATALNAAICQLNP